MTDANRIALATRSGRLMLGPPERQRWNAMIPFRVFLEESLRARRLRRLRQGVLPGGRTRPTFTRHPRLLDAGPCRGRRWTETPAFADGTDDGPIRVVADHDDIQAFCEERTRRQMARRADIRIRARARKQRRGWR